MKTQIKTHSDLHKEMENNISKIRLSSQEEKSVPISRDNNISIIIVTSPSSTSKGFYADDSGRKQKVTYFSVRSNNRSRAKLIVEKCLDDLGISFSEDNSTSMGSMGGFAIKINDKTAKIVFKFKSGLEQTDFKGWNEPLTRIFEKKSELKRVPSDRNERDQLRNINSKIKNPITLIISGKKFRNVVGLVGGKSGQKSDLVIIDSQGNEIGWSW